jgi:hypothetical protein
MKAFPNTRLIQQAVSFDNDEGMDLRDYFAAKAMEQIKFKYHTDGKSVFISDAQFCYMVADAMMEARKK